MGPKRSAEEIATMKEAAKRHKAERERFRRANFSETQKERDRLRHRISNLTPLQIEQRRLKNRIVNMTAEQIERHRSRNRIENMTAERIEQHRSRNRINNMTAEQIERHRSRNRIDSMTPEQISHCTEMSDSSSAIMTNVPKPISHFPVIDDNPECVGDGKTCGECGKIFSHPFYFSTHIGMHASEKDYPIAGQCVQCGLTFRDAQLFQQHLLSSEAKLNDQRCAEVNTSEEDLAQQEKKCFEKVDTSQKRKKEHEHTEPDFTAELVSVKKEIEDDVCEPNLKRRRQATQRFVPKARPHHDPDNDPEVQAYLLSLTEMGLTVDPAAFGRPPGRGQGKNWRGTRGRSRSNKMPLSKGFLVLPASIDPPKKASPKYEYLEYDVMEEDAEEVLPKSGKQTRGERLQRRLQRLSQQKEAAPDAAPKTESTEDSNSDLTTSSLLASSQVQKTEEKPIKPVPSCFTSTDPDRSFPLDKAMKKSEIEDEDYTPHSRAQNKLKVRGSKRSRGYGRWSVPQPPTPAVVAPKQPTVISTMPLFSSQRKVHPSALPPPLASKINNQGAIATQLRMKTPIVNQPLKTGRIPDANKNKEPLSRNIKASPSKGPILDRFPKYLKVTSQGGIEHAKQESREYVEIMLRNLTDDLIPNKMSNNFSSSKTFFGKSVGFSAGPSGIASTSKSSFSHTGPRKPISAGRGSAMAGSVNCRFPGGRPFLRPGISSSMQHSNSSASYRLPNPAPPTRGRGGGLVRGINPTRSKGATANRGTAYPVKIGRGAGLPPTTAPPKNKIAPKLAIDCMEEVIVLDDDDDEVVLVQDDKLSNTSPKKLAFIKEIDRNSKSDSDIAEIITLPEQICQSSGDNNEQLILSPSVCLTRVDEPKSEVCSKLANKALNFKAGSFAEESSLSLEAVDIEGWKVSLVQDSESDSDTNNTSRIEKGHCGDAVNPDGLKPVTADECNGCKEPSSSVLKEPSCLDKDSEVNTLCCLDSNKTKLAGPDENDDGSHGNVCTEQVETGVMNTGAGTVNDNSDSQDSCLGAVPLTFPNVSKDKDNLLDDFSEIEKTCKEIEENSGNEKEDSCSETEKKNAKGSNNSSCDSVSRSPGQCCHDNNSIDAENRFDEEKSSVWGLDKSSDKTGVSTLILTLQSAVVADVPAKQSDSSDKDKPVKSDEVNGTVNPPYRAVMTDHQNQPNSSAACLGSNNIELTLIAGQAMAAALAGINTDIRSNSKETSVSIIHCNSRQAPETMGSLPSTLSTSNSYHGPQQEFDQKEMRSDMEDGNQAAEAPRNTEMFFSTSTPEENNGSAVDEHCNEVSHTVTEDMGCSRSAATSEHTFFTAAGNIETNIRQLDVCQSSTSICNASIVALQEKQQPKKKSPGRNSCKEAEPTPHHFHHGDDADQDGDPHTCSKNTNSLIGPNSTNVSSREKTTTANGGSGGSQHLSCSNHLLIKFASGDKNLASCPCSHSIWKKHCGCVKFPASAVRKKCLNNKGTLSPSFKKIPSHSQCPIQRRSWSKIGKSVAQSGQKGTCVCGCAGLKPHKQCSVKPKHNLPHEAWKPYISKSGLSLPCDLWKCYGAYSVNYNYNTHDFRSSTIRNLELHNRYNLWKLRGAQTSQKYLPDLRDTVNRVKTAVKLSDQGYNWLQRNARLPCFDKQMLFSKHWFYIRNDKKKITNLSEKKLRFCDMKLRRDLRNEKFKPGFVRNVVKSCDRYSYLMKRMGFRKESSGLKKPYKHQCCLRICGQHRQRLRCHSQHKSQGRRRQAAGCGKDSSKTSSMTRGQAGGSTLQSKGNQGSGGDGDGNKDGGNEELRNVVEDASLSCSICGVKFKHLEDSQEHMVKKHSGKKGLEFLGVTTSHNSVSNEPNQHPIHTKRVSPLSEFIESSLSNINTYENLTTGQTQVILVRPTKPVVKLRSDPVHSCKTRPGKSVKKTEISKMQHSINKAETGWPLISVKKECVTKLDSVVDKLNESGAVCGKLNELKTVKATEFKLTTHRLTNNMVPDSLSSSSTVDRAITVVKSEPISDNEEEALPITFDSSCVEQSAEFSGSSLLPGVQSQNANVSQNLGSVAKSKQATNPSALGRAGMIQMTSLIPALARKHSKVEVEVVMVYPTKPVVNTASRSMPLKSHCVPQGKTDQSFLGKKKLRTLMETVNKKVDTSPHSSSNKDWNLQSNKIDTTLHSLTNRETSPYLLRSHKASQKLLSRKDTSPRPLNIKDSQLQTLINEATSPHSLTNEDSVLTEKNTSLKTLKTADSLPLSLHKEDIAPQPLHKKVTYSYSLRSKRSLPEMLNKAIEASSTINGETSAKPSHGMMSAKSPHLSLKRSPQLLEAWEATKLDKTITSQLAATQAKPMLNTGNTLKHKESVSPFPCAQRSQANLTLVYVHPKKPVINYSGRAPRSIAKQVAPPPIKKAKRF